MNDTANAQQLQSMLIMKKTLSFDQFVNLDGRTYLKVKDIFKEKEELEAKTRKELSWMSKLTEAKQELAEKNETLKSLLYGDAKYDDSFLFKVYGEGVIIRNQDNVKKNRQINDNLELE